MTCTNARTRLEYHPDRYTVFLLDEAGDLLLRTHRRTLSSALEAFETLKFDCDMPGECVEVYEPGKTVPYRRYTYAANLWRPARGR